VRYCVPGAVGRSELSVSFVRHRESFRVVRFATTSGGSHAPRRGSPSRSNFSVQGLVPERSNRRMTPRTIPSALERDCNDSTGFSLSPVPGTMCGNVERLEIAEHPVSESLSRLQASPLDRPPVGRKSACGTGSFVRLDFHPTAGLRCGDDNRDLECRPRERGMEAAPTMSNGGGPSDSKRCHRSPMDVQETSGGDRTHPQRRVKHEKGNVDQRPPTRGKPDRHR
jgi:hypothetical protein